jgi:hypothetical protein
LALMSPPWDYSEILPAMTLRRVVFPAPEAPMMAVTCPALKIPETPLRIYFLTLVPRQGTVNVRIYL